VRRQVAADQKLYSQFIRPGDLVFDIGANLGQKAEIFLKLGARVIALEPNQNCRPVLLRDLGASGRFTLLSKAVGSTAGTGSLTFANTISTASLKQDWHGLMYRDGHLEQTTVSITTLDKLIDEYGMPQFCKIDVEGFEREVIRGLSQPIPVISLEYHSKDVEEIVACLELLDGLRPIEINAIAMNAGEFVMPEWCALDIFLGWLIQGDIPPAGDVFARSHPVPDATEISDSGKA
jgi:FkbM family methyltransferase